MVCGTRVTRPSGNQFLAPDVRAGELDVFAPRRHFHPELLHALVHEAVADCCAAAHGAVTDGHKVEHIRHNTRGKAFARDGKLPVRLLGRISENFVGAIRQAVHGNFAQTGKCGGSQADARHGSRADLRGFLCRAGHAQRRDADLVREILERLFQLHLEPPGAEHARGEIHADFSVNDLPILNAFAAHVRDGESRLRRQLKSVNAGFFDPERQTVGNHQPRFFEPHVYTVNGGDDRLDMLEFERQREGTGVEPVGGEGVVRCVDLAQTGERPDFDEHVFSGNRQRPGFPLHIQWLRRIQ